MDKKREINVDELIHILRYYPKNNKIVIVNNKGASFNLVGPIVKQQTDEVVLCIEEAPEGHFICSQAGCNTRTKNYAYYCSKHMEKLFGYEYYRTAAGQLIPLAEYCDADNLDKG